MIVLPRFEQELVGRFEQDGVARALDLTLASDEPALTLAAQAKRISVEGTISAQGVATRRRVWGSVDVSRLSTARDAYQLLFDSDAGARCELVAARARSTRVPAFAVSRLTGVLRIPGRPEAPLELRQDLRRALGRWLRLGS